MGQPKFAKRTAMLIGGIALAAVFLLFLLFLGGEIAALIRSVVNRDMHPALLLLLFVLLPVIGFPMSIFLVLIGWKSPDGSMHN